MALSAICWAVIGRCGDIDGVWIEPVTAQVMMTLLALATVHSLPRLRQSLSKPGPIAKGPAWRCKPCGGIAGVSRTRSSHAHPAGIFANLGFKGTLESCGWPPRRRAARGAGAATLKVPALAARFARQRGVS